MIPEKSAASYQVKGIWLKNSGESIKHNSICGNDRGIQLTVVVKCD